MNREEETAGLYEAVSEIHMQKNPPPIGVSRGGSFYPRKRRVVSAVRRGLQDSRKRAHEEALVENERRDKKDTRKDTCEETPLYERR